jgi:hypothetical protein
LSRGDVLCGRPGPLRSRLLVRGKLGEALLHDLAPWRLCRRCGQQCAQRSLGRLTVAALQRGFCAIKAGAGIISGLGKFGLGLRSNVAWL